MTQQAERAAREALQPCPFCNGEAMVAGLGEHSSVWVAQCRQCHARLDDRTSQAVIAAWNTRTAIAAMSPQASTVLEEALRDARSAIASLPEFALGGVVLTDTVTGEATGQYGVRDELLSKIDAALSQPAPAVGDAPAGEVEGEER